MGRGGRGPGGRGRAEGGRRAHGPADGLLRRRTLGHHLTGLGGDGGGDGLAGVEPVEQEGQGRAVDHVAHGHHALPAGLVARQGRERAQPGRPARVTDHPDSQRVADAERQPAAPLPGQQAEERARGGAEADVRDRAQHALALLGPPLAAGQQAADDVLGRLPAHESRLLARDHDGAHRGGGERAAHGSVDEFAHHAAAAARLIGRETATRAVPRCSRGP